MSCQFPDKGAENKTLLSGYKLAHNSKEETFECEQQQ